MRGTLSGISPKKKELRVLLIQEEEEIDGEGDESLTIEIVAKKVELSLNSVVGLATPGTMKLTGKVGEHLVTILIDIGATHNFISLGLVQELGLPITAT